MSYYKLENALLTYDISSEILKNFGTEPPVVVCLGSDRVLSDMVGVLVADLLKQRNVNIFVFGGSNRCFNKQNAKYIAKRIDPSRLLFVDSGLLQQKNSIAVMPYLILNDGTKINSTSIIAGTIQKENGRVCLAKLAYADLKKYAIAIADSICEYLAYVEILKNKKFCM